MPFVIELLFGLSLLALTILLFLTCAIVIKDLIKD